MTVLFDGRASTVGAGPWTGYNVGPWGETSWRMPDNNEVAGRGRGNRRCEVVSDPLGQKGLVFRSELFSGDGPAISSLATSRRSELSHTGTLFAAPGTFWFAFDTLLLSPWVEDTGLCPTTIWQLHDTLDASDAGRRPVFELEVEAGVWKMPNGFVHADGNETINNVAHPQPFRYITTGRVSDLLDRWTPWVVRMTLSPTDGSGAITVWKDRRVIFQDSGPRNCGVDALGSFLTTGIYCPVNWPQPGISSRVAFSTGVVAGSSAFTSFNSFMVGIGRDAETELERVMPIKLAAA